MGKVLIALFILLTLFCVLFTIHYQRVIYPHVSVGSIDVSGQLPKTVETYWLSKNTPFSSMQFKLQYDEKVATLSGTDLGLGYDATLSATQAYLIGRSTNWATNLYFLLFQKSVNLPPMFHWNAAIVDAALTDIAAQVNIPATEALFQFQNGRVTNFQPSSNGRELNIAEANARIAQAFQTQTLSIPMPIDVVKPIVTTDKANTFGITQLIGTGYSEFAGSTAERIHNVALAASRINGVLIKPGETFSFNDTVGDITAATGYQSAYIIKDGHTVLGDGGGVCQVSTTLFRAALNAGLPIVERHAHDYRVHYYEEGGFKPGLDATVYGPTYDLKFKNDTPTSILIQAKTDVSHLSLTFDLYGTSDGRKSQISNQQLWGVAPPPPDLYQDDPTLAKGVVKQVDFSAWGAKASFDYTVTHSDNTVTKITFLSNYQPWQAVFLRGTL
jgi:vancomycin resistance protein YoaR